MISFSFCFTSSYVYGESMKPTINNYADYEHNRDVVYIDKNASYTYGDIIVIKKNDIEIIKRVIALPGDTIDIKNVDGKYVVMRNDQVLEEDYIRIVPGSAD
ncbi:MAG: signal peptidase I [Clostridia bacterium]|nr:signal peptidase I [Clostridia bacterium]